MFAGAEPGAERGEDLAHGEDLHGAHGFVREEFHQASPDICFRRLIALAMWAAAMGSLFFAAMRLAT